MSSAISYQNIITSSIGEIGKSQWIIVLACNLPNFLGAWSMIIVSFAAAKVDWWRISEDPNVPGNFTKIYKQCPIGPNDTLEFDPDVYSIQKEWMLICSEENILVWVKTCQMSGVFVGAAVMGQLGDWFGRKKCFIFVYAINVISIFLVGFSVNWIMMIICIFIVGFSLGGTMVLQKILTMEYVGTSWRTFFGLIPFWASGVLLLGCLYIGLPNWRYLYILNGSLGVPLVVAMWFVPESIRWLFSQGKVDEGKELLKKLAKRNGLAEPDLSKLEMILGKDKNRALRYNYVTLFKFKITRWRCPLFGFLWFTCAYSYYALTFEVSLLKGNTGANMALFGLGESISLCFVWLISKGLGRKYTTMLFFVLTSSSSFGITIAYGATDDADKAENIRRALAIVSRFMLSAAWGSLMIYTVEIFPTKLRSSAYGFVSVLARVGGIVAPQSEPLYTIAKHIPYTINGGLAAVCAFLIVFLHDTYSQELQDNLEEEINSGKADYKAINISN